MDKWHEYNIEILNHHPFTTQKISFIDCVSQILGKGCPEHDNDYSVLIRTANGHCHVYSSQQTINSLPCHAYFSITWQKKVG
jgi:hypothetical protein